VASIEGTLRAHKQFTNALLLDGPAPLNVAEAGGTNKVDAMARGGPRQGWQAARGSRGSPRRTTRARAVWQSAAVWQSWPHLFRKVDVHWLRRELLQHVDGAGHDLQMEVDLCVARPRAGTGASA
jgi:hypothetical protein